MELLTIQSTPRINEASDQPCAGDPIDPYLLPGGPPLAAIRAALEMPNARVERWWFMRRKVPGDSSICFCKGLGALGLGRAREVVNGHNGRMLPLQLLELPPGLCFWPLSEGGAKLG